MKRIICELCGSSDLIKQDGIITCQSCGCKYTIEEAKKLMIDGPVEVKGTVSIDKTDSLKNLYQVIRTSMLDGLFSNAYSQVNEALSIQPDNPELLVIQGLANFGKESNITDIPSSTINALNRFFTSFEGWDIDLAEKRTIIENVQKYIQGVCMHHYEQFAQELKECQAQIADCNTGINYSQQRLNNAKPSITATLIVAGQTINDVNSYQHVIVQVNSRIERLKEQIKDFRRFELSCYDRIIKARETLVQQVSDYLEKKREEYWKSHKEEKEKLELNIATWKQYIDELTVSKDAINKKIDAINEELNNQKTPLEKKQDELNDRVRALEHQQDSLGIFKWKEKKALADEIALIRSQMPQIQDITTEKTEFRLRKAPELNALVVEMKPILDEISDLTGKIEKAKNELYKPTEVEDIANNTYRWIKDFSTTTFDKELSEYDIIFKELRNIKIGKNIWSCKICGYIYEGAQPPEKCLVCKAPASKFERQM